MAVLKEEGENLMIFDLERAQFNFSFAKLRLSCFETKTSNLIIVREICDAELKRRGINV